MKSIILALIELLRPYMQTLGAVVSTILIKDAWKDAEREQKRVEALEARIAAQNKVAAMSDADVSRMLNDSWDNPKQRM